MSKFLLDGYSFVQRVAGSDLNEKVRRDSG